MNKENIKQLVIDKLNLLSLPIPITTINNINELKSWVTSLNLPSAVNTIRFTSSYMLDKFNSFNIDDFEEKTDRAYTDDEYVNQLMNYLGYTSLYNMLEKNHPSLNDEYKNIPCVYYDNNSSAYLIVNDVVVKYNTKSATLGNKISNFFSN